MSKTEPVPHGTLWLRPRKNTLNKKGPTQFDIWYFSESGWKPLADFDTRYNIEPSYDKTPSKESIDISPNANLENGIVTNNINFKIYDGLRDLQSSSNFVLESGLKKEVDKIMDYINAEISKLNGKINALSNTIDNLSRVVSNNTDRLTRIEGILSALES